MTISFVRQGRRWTLRVNPKEVIAQLVGTGIAVWLVYRMITLI
jgi:hypothetical protein